MPTASPEIIIVIKPEFPSRELGRHHKLSQEAIIKTIQTNAAPAAIGPYSQALIADKWLYSSGQIALTADGKLASAGIESQTEQVFRNLRAILAEAGVDLDSVVKVTVYLKDLDDFATMNTVYERAFGAHKPARSTVEVARLPRDALVEIDVVARLS